MLTLLEAWRATKPVGTKIMPIRRNNEITCRTNRSERGKRR